MASEPRSKLNRLLRAWPQGTIAVRMFMFLAESHNHAWAKKLDLSKVNFGKGKRMIIKGGRLDAKYNITVPNSGG